MLCSARGDLGQGELRVWASRFRSGIPKACVLPPLASEYRRIKGFVRKFGDPCA